MPVNINVSDTDQTWLKKVITVKNQIDQTKLKSNKTPATVGEYYKKYLK